MVGFGFKDKKLKVNYWIWFICLAYPSQTRPINIIKGLKFQNCRLFMYACVSGCMLKILSHALVNNLNMGINYRKIITVSFLPSILIVRLNK